MVVLIANMKRGFIAVGIKDVSEKTVTLAQVLGKLAFKRLNDSLVTCL